ncbi:MAG: alpha/beta hydrolase [Bradyrhizobium sp.]|uniref:esterase/lipase family protein n=1 Tax=Bradyrhizobium sp. TaxID=376 RepID=UPI001C29D5F7|nr:alpha/beta hydrolase [Bradyrhizobium sp.]MBU6461732.1 alpha/beta hydrolase [Pseudomonadota bacterium]MDE2068340.1 alpha/beta hydrolase [Bradyrhizobium sp.]MDE2241018.1 alpha/beta hydrolase [Bradyrhizobium sp.]
MPPTAGEPRASDKLRPPSLGLLLAEARGIFEFNTSLLLAPLLMRAPRGDGHPVLALPGFLASDLSLAPLRRYLSELGYDAHAWQMGRNTGGVSRMRSGLRDRLASIHATTGRKVSIVGWSLGGVYARDLALQAPEMVRGVVTLASPFAGDVRATNATRLYEAMSGQTVEEDSELRRAIAGDLPVPATSIYSRADGIVNWRTCLLRSSDTAENIEVHLASHTGIGVNAAALWAIADRLAQPEGQFSPFDRSGPFAMAYALPENAQSVY